MDQGDGKQAYGIFIQNGRLKGDMKKALRRVIERYELPVRITPNQNLILCDIEESWKSDIISTLSTAGVRCVDFALCCDLDCFFEMIRCHQYAQQGLSCCCCWVCWDLSASVSVSLSQNIGFVLDKKLL